MIQPSDGCPCTVEGIEPCRSTCSCAHPYMSGGCSRCAKYGSLEQRQSHARHIAAAVRIYSTLASPSAFSDMQRIDWMERHLCRVGEVKNSSGQTVKLARVWSIMGELETLRETIDAAMEKMK